MSNQVVKVVVSALSKPLYYVVPDNIFDVEVGSEVLVGLGKRQVKGWVIGRLSLEQAQEELKGKFNKNSESKLITIKNEKTTAQLNFFSQVTPQTPRKEKAKELKPILTAIPAFLPEQLPLFEWMADYYGVALCEIIENAIPHSKLGKKSRRKQSSAQSPSDLKKGIFNNPGPDRLVPGQIAALEIIEKSLETRTFSPLLLFGVTGSGKTEIYLRAIEKVLNRGGSALVVVPEIALTPQLFDQFESRLSVPLSLLHSQVGPTARWEAWSNLLDGSVRIAVGARSSIFAPLRNLQLVIVDEEHESSYKQSDGLRYNARDVAVMRAKLSGATVILGSATPSFESLINVSKGRYKLIEMPERATARPLPTIEVVTLNKIKRAEMPTENISPQLHQAIEETLKNGGQTVILYNKRGFSTFLQCDSCGEVLSCPNCSVTLTYHKHQDRVVCHYCGETTSPPKYCKFCRDPRTSRIEDFEELTSKAQEKLELIGLLSPRGAGTEKVVDELSLLFPQARILRMDRDTVRKKDAYRSILGDMRSGNADILVGTQMIAKGHDLPGVTLVGIIDADVGLHLPDFRSSEKVYQLITQAAGRAGRGAEAGRVIIQTREPKHPTIVATVTGRFKAFVRYELDYRKSLDYPPWARLMRLIISSTDQQEAYQAALLVREQVNFFLTSSSDSTNTFPNYTVLGPAPAPHIRLRSRYRWHILIKCKSAKVISELASKLYYWRDGVKQFRDFRLSIDVDPLDML